VKLDGRGSLVGQFLRHRPWGWHLAVLALECYGVLVSSQLYQRARAPGGQGHLFFWFVFAVQIGLTTSGVLAWGTSVSRVWLVHALALFSPGAIWLTMMVAFAR
jgi:hypothetical protein